MKPKIFLNLALYIDDDEWDKQMKNDWQSGKLNKLIEKAEADIKAKKVKEIDEILCNS